MCVHFCLYALKDRSLLPLPPCSPRKRQSVHPFTSSSSKQLGEDLVLTPPPLVLSLSYSFPTHVSHFFLHPYRRRRPLRAVSLSRPRPQPISPGPQSPWAAVNEPVAPPLPPAYSTIASRNSISPSEGVYAEGGRPGSRTTRAASVRRLHWARRAPRPSPCAPGERAVAGGAGGRPRGCPEAQGALEGERRRRTERRSSFRR